jgi:hypothetical protein
MYNSNTGTEEYLKEKEVNCEYYCIRGSKGKSERLPSVPGILTPPVICTLKLLHSKRYRSLDNVSL